MHTLFFFCFLSLGFSLFCDFLRESEVLNDEFVVLLDLRTLARAYFFCLCDGYQMLTWLFGGVVCVGLEGEGSKPKAARLACWHVGEERMY